MTPSPTTEIYIKHSNILSFTSNAEKVSAPQLHINIKNAAKPTVLLDDILADINGGHNIVSTVYIECGAMYKASGPEEMRPIGETEFVNGIAAMSASGHYGASRVASGIIGHANLLLGDAVIPVLESQISAGGGRFRGIRHSVPWDKSNGLTTDLLVRVMDLLIEVMDLLVRVMDLLIRVMDLLIRVMDLHIRVMDLFIRVI